MAHKNSISRAEFLNNFTCDIFIKRVNREGNVDAQENSDWGSRLVDMGFEQGKRKKTYQGPGEYDGETLTTYSTQYTFGEDKDKIVVINEETTYSYFGETSFKESNVEITFSTSEQLEAFVTSLKNFGYKNFDKYDGKEYSGTIGNNICVQYIWWIDRKKNKIYTTHSQC